MVSKPPRELSRDLVKIADDLHGSLGRQCGGPELALFVIWEKARFLQNQIIEMIGDTFEIRGVHEVVWDPHRADENFARFYQGRAAPPRGSYFREQKGGGAFLVVTVADYEPIYEARETHRGQEVLNARCFDLKHRIRSQVGGVMRVHSTDSGAEAARDLLLLMGVTPARYLREQAAPWDGRVDTRHGNLAGCDGWQNMEELLEVLNHGVRYVVLRNAENFPGGLSVEAGHQVSMLTDNYHELVRLLNARPLHRTLPRWGGRFVVNVSGQEQAVELRFVGDGYFDAGWASRLLERREWQERGFFAPAPDDYFETLAYHAIVHNPALSHEYRRRLQQLAIELERPGWEAEELSESDVAVRRLQELMSARNYTHVRPKDPTAFFNFLAAGYGLPKFRSRLAAVKCGAFVCWYRIGYFLRYVVVRTRQWLIRLFPSVRMLWPSYRRLVQRPTADRAHG